MIIKQSNNESKGVFEAMIDNVKVGEMTYSWAGNDKIIIDHTEVNPEFKGQNIGKQLLLEVVNFARDNNIKIIPLCPFAKSVFDKTPDIKDVLLQ